MKSANLELLLSYFENLENQNYYGTVEVTLQAGQIAFTREIRSRQDFEIAADSWDKLSDNAKLELRKKLGNNTKFLDIIKKRCLT